MTAGEFDMVTAGWSPDYDDPMTYGDLFASWNLNNRGRYENAELDRQVRNAMATLDTPTRMNAFARVQDILLEDAVIIPMYERGQVFVRDPRLQGVVRRVVGTDPDFTHAYVGERKR
jgi:oligopeptide transport system substrate-binding protein